MGEGEQGREDGKQHRSPGLKKIARNSFRGPPPLLASCLAVAGAHLMCRQHSEPRNVYGPDVHRNMPSTVVRDAFVLSTWETAWLSPGLGGRQLQIREVIFGVVCIGQCEFEKDSMLLFYFFWPQLNKENMLQISEVSTFSFEGLKRLTIWIIKFRISFSYRLL